jgi:predicted RNase H-like nuclease (RuvC/YqgF family)
MRIEIGGLKCEVEESRKLSRKLSGELRVLNTKNTELMRESKSDRFQIKQLSNLVEDFNREHEEKESASQAEARVDEDVQIIKAMLTGVSSRQAEALQLNSKKKSYINEMRHSVGWMQEIINATFLAGCANIRQLGHDGVVYRRLRLLASAQL